MPQKQCPRCLGVGTVTCNRCNGNGVDPQTGKKCRMCNGKLEVQCWICKGSGHVPA
jgi:hypothetical protein